MKEYFPQELINLQFDDYMVISAFLKRKYQDYGELFLVCDIQTFRIDKGISCLVDWLNFGRSQDNRENWVNINNVPFDVAESYFCNVLNSRALAFQYSTAKNKKQELIINDLREFHKSFRQSRIGDIFKN